MNRATLTNGLFAFFERKSRSLSRLIAAGLVVALLVVSLHDLRTILDSRMIENWVGPPHSSMDFVPWASGAVCALVVALAVWPRVGRWATMAAGVTVPTVVLVASVLLWPSPMGMFGYPIYGAETLGLLIVLSLVALRCHPWQILPVSVLCFFAALSDYLREPIILEPTVALLMVLVGLAPGAYLRWRTMERQARVHRVRAEERLAIARDLHDVVAHEVTGIVVRVQALRHVADRRPELVGEALPEIEEAGTRALESMRGMVSRLRGPEDAPLTSDPVDGLWALAAPAEHGRPEVSVRLAGPMAELPPEVGTAAWRIAQESVTNALRHARGASRVDIDVRADTDAMTLRVVDDGRGGARGSGPAGGGHGLVGMGERARVLGGELSAGPSGQGWMVSATIPIPERGTR
ncbi:histidine kinase [Nocardiopsis sp. NPDC006832]|uniref:sensor histidine kinase n=1 Tax=Nocardiopsis sp. NPDC006832 TaxID=3157188 RepID=UPI0033C29708